MKEQLRIRQLAEKSFIDYFKQLTNKRISSNQSNWLSALYYLESFSGGNLKFADLNEGVLDEFKAFLLTTKRISSKNLYLSRNSAASYFNKIKAALRQAYHDGILHYDLNSKIQPIKPEETRREYLTLGELNSLVKTPCDNDTLKRAALFSALTGLRFSDIQKMTWQEIEFIEGQGYFIKFKQQKTKSIEVMPISDQAYGLCGQRNDGSMKVFHGLSYSAYHNKHLTQWIISAGITKKITFHNFRHTYATLQLYNGTDIYTVSKLLGHKDLKTTQIYTKIVDDAKRIAVNKIHLEMPDQHLWNL